MSVNEMRENRNKIFPTKMLCFAFWSWLLSVLIHNSHCFASNQEGLKMDRYLTRSIRDSSEKKITLISGPRQCGKTTLTKQLFKDYDSFNYDNDEDRDALKLKHLTRLTQRAKILFLRYCQGTRSKCAPWKFSGMQSAQRDTLSQRCFWIPV